MANISPDMYRNFLKKAESLSNIAGSCLNGESPEGLRLPARFLDEIDNKSLFNYKAVQDNERIGVEISIQSSIIAVNGVPFIAYVGDNVNQLIDRHIQNKLV